MNFLQSTNRKTGIKQQKTSDYDLSKLGIDKVNSLRIVNNIDELKKHPHNIIIAESTRDVEFTQNRSKKQRLKKKGKYVMGLGMFEQLHLDPRNLKDKILKPASIKFNSLYKQYQGQDLTNKTLLVWRTGGIGDLLFIQPNLIYLKQKYPTCKIKFACGPQYQSMVKAWAFIDEVLDLPFGFQKLIQSDYHVIFEGVIERTKQSETENAYNLFSKWMGLDLSNDLLQPKQEPKKETLNEVQNKIEELGFKGKDFILLQLKASSPIRTPSPDVWLKIVNELLKDGNKIIITDAPHNSDMVNKFLEKVDQKYINKDIFNFSPYSLELDYGVALCSLAKIVVGTDSAMMHIAASLDVPCMGVYGPFPGEIRLSLYKNSDWVNCKKECSPCFSHMNTPCKNSKGGYSQCYENIDINEFITKFRKVLENANK